MVIEFEPDVELTTAPFWIRVRQTPSPAACLALAAVVYRSLWPSATSRRSLEARFSCSLVIFDGLRPASAQAASAAFDDGGACVGGIGSACGAGGVCDCGSGVAGCFTSGVYGGVAGGPSRLSSPSSAMVVESKLDVKLSTASFWFRPRDVRRPSASEWDAFRPASCHLRTSAALRRSLLEQRLSCRWLQRRRRHATAAAALAQVASAALRRMRWRHRQHMRRWRRMRLRRRWRKLRRSRRVRRCRSWPRPLLLYH